MGSPENGSDEPLTPGGRLFLQKEMNQVIYSAIGMKQPLKVDALKSAIQSSPMFTHPRFCILMVRDSAGREASLTAMSSQSTAPSPKASLTRQLSTSTSATCPPTHRGS
ncbi:hypothetical protein ACJRO7_034701 [Eucalyptus globulus]|uniref:Uncharacterized protein n=1 Tax=Eucalyptus globulus TaxID=34317 RepID=A0ABD3JE31_EUCGL